MAHLAMAPPVAEKDVVYMLTAKGNIRLRVDQLGCEKLHTDMTETQRLLHDIAENQWMYPNGHERNERPWFGSKALSCNMEQILCIVSEVYERELIP